MAYVERGAGSALTKADVIGFCRGEVASFKIPRHVVFIEARPITASGTIRKVALREDAVRRLLPATAGGD